MCGEARSGRGGSGIFKNEGLPEMEVLPLTPLRTMEILQKQTKTNGGGGGLSYLFFHSMKKIARFFKKQREFFLISCMAVA